MHCQECICQKRWRLFQKASLDLTVFSDFQAVIIDLVFSQNQFELVRSYVTYATYSVQIEVLSELHSKIHKNVNVLTCSASQSK